MVNAGMIDSILGDLPELHTTQEGERTSFSVNHEALRHISSIVTGSMSTIETGCGVSTVVLALSGARHICVAANPSHIELLKTYCSERAISLDNLRFSIGRSEDVLPSLDLPLLDFALIDGGHAFPIPYLDWFYIGRRLKVGGVIAIDDIQIPTVKVLYDFLLLNPDWKLGRKIGRMTFFQKVREIEQGVWDYWSEQPFNVTWAMRLKRLFR
jgi:hypothetical protein